MTEKNQKTQNDDNGASRDSSIGNTKEVFSIDSSSLNELRNEAIRRVSETKHTWVQRGPYLVCKSCENEHGIHIGTGKILVDIDKDGNPVFDKL